MHPFISAQSCLCNSLWGFLWFSSRIKEMFALGEKKPFQIQHFHSLRLGRPQSLWKFWIRQTWKNRGTSRFWRMACWGHSRGLGLKVASCFCISACSLWFMVQCRISSSVDTTAALSGLCSALQASEFVKFTCILKESWWHQPPAFGIKLILCVCFFFFFDFPLL